MFTNKLLSFICKFATCKTTPCALVLLRSVKGSEQLKLFIEPQTGSHVGGASDLEVSAVED